MIQIELLYLYFASSFSICAYTVCDYCNPFHCTSINIHTWIFPPVCQPVAPPQKLYSPSHSVWNRKCHLRWTAQAPPPTSSLIQLSWSSLPFRLRHQCPSLTVAAMPLIYLMASTHFPIMPQCTGSSAARPSLQVKLHASIAHDRRSYSPAVRYFGNPRQSNEWICWPFQGEMWRAPCCPVILRTSRRPLRRASPRPPSPGWLQVRELFEFSCI